MSYFVEAAPTNGPDDADSAMNWVNITGYVNDRLGPVTVTYGRQTELQAVNPGSLTLTLNNNDHRFTSGNPTSPYYPGWREGMRIRVRETVGPRQFIHFDGNMLQPDLTIRTDGLDQTVVVNTIDRIGRLGAARTFVSTLTEYIRYNAGSTIKGYWALADAAGSTSAREVIGTGLGALTLEGALAGTAAIPLPLLSFGSAAGPVGDDASLVQFSPILNSANSVVVADNRLVNRVLGGIPMTSSFTTLVGWVLLTNTNTGGGQVFVLHDNVSVNTIQISYIGGNNAAWQATVINTSGTAIITGPAPAWGSWQIVGCRINNATGAVDFWIDGVSLTGTTTGASTGVMDVLVVEGSTPGQATGHVQIYTGSSTGFDRVKFDAQRSAGINGLAQQLAGDRITTLALYAGMSTADLAIDPGTAVMQAARIAGKTPLAAMQVAADADQGLLHAVGRKLVFHSRKRRYDL